MNCNFPVIKHSLKKITWCNWKLKSVNIIYNISFLLIEKMIFMSSVSMTESKNKNENHMMFKIFNLIFISFWKWSFFLIKQFITARHWNPVKQNTIQCWLSRVDGDLNSFFWLNDDDFVDYKKWFRF